MTNLSNRLTVFLITSGKDPNYQACLNALKNQDCKFKLNVIRDIRPMSKAFQEMLDRCTTPYYIQCDSDMILNRNAIKFMYDNIEGNHTKSKESMHAYMLRDVHLDMSIYGIKIYKYDNFKKYPYNLNHPSCEMEQLERMEKDGYFYNLKEQVVGEHSPHWTNETIFERYYNLMEKFKIYRYVWMEKLPNKLWEKLKTAPTKLNMYAFAGALSSIFSDKVMDEEKDFAIKRKDYGALLSYFDQPHQCTLYITYNCNHKCHFCYREHQDMQKAPDMTPEIVDTIRCKFPSIKGFCLCGFGEPLASPNLISILKKLKSANKYVGIITNGSLIKKKFSELCGWYKPDYISVSLNANTKEEHEKATGVKTFDKVIEGIKLLVKSPIPIYISSVVTTENLNKVPDLIRFVKGLGVKTLHLHNLLPHFDESKDNKFWDLVLTTKYKRYIDQWKNLPESDIVKIYPTLIDKSGGQNACDFPWYSLAVNGNGDISYCNSVFPCNSKYGNIKDFVVWNSQAAKKFRDKFCKGNISHCRKCFRNWKVR